nr:hypothetical protein [Tanacetum cinerariifolium]
MKVMPAYDATDNQLPISPLQAPIASPTVMPPVLSLFYSQDFPSPEEISPPKDAETPVESSIPVSPSSSIGSSSPVRSITPQPDYPFGESIYEELDNSLWIIPQPLGSKPVPEEPNKQLVADSVIAALEAQTATVANTNNTNRNTELSGTLIARKGTNDHKQMFNDRKNTTKNNNYPNNRNNNRNDNNYQDNCNNNNRNNNYHQQQDRRQETIMTYATTPTENKGVRIATRWDIRPGTAEAKDQPREVICD